MAAHFSEPRAASAAVLHPMLFFAALGALSSSPAPMPWSAPCSIAKRKKKKRAKKEDRRKQRQQERTEKGIKTDLGGLEPRSSASKPEWLKKATPHPLGNRSCSCSVSLMWYLCPGGQTESNYTRTVWLMCLSCDSGAMPRIWVLEVSLSTCTELQALLLAAGCFLAMV